MPGPFIPLTNQDCDSLNFVCESAPGVDEAVKKCKRAGFPIDEMEAENLRQLELARGLKREFFPDR